MQQNALFLVLGGVTIGMSVMALWFIWVNAILRRRALIGKPLATIPVRQVDMPRVVELLQATMMNPGVASRYILWTFLEEKYPEAQHGLWTVFLPSATEITLIKIAAKRPEPTFYPGA